MESIERYYYCPDYKKYVREYNGIFYVIENGKENIDMFYSRIWFSDIFSDDITKEEYYAKLD